MKVEPNDTLSKLNEQMNAEGFPGEQAFSFVPHITISQDLSEDEHSDVYGTLKISSFDLKIQLIVSNCFISSMMVLGPSMRHISWVNREK